MPSMLHQPHIPPEPVAEHIPSDAALQAPDVLVNGGALVPAQRGREAARRTGHGVEQPETGVVS